MKHLINNLQRFFKSFFFAFRGFTVTINSERNFRFHISFAILTIILGMIANITDAEFTAIIICIAIVLGFELTNTAIEHLCDEVTKEKRDNIRKSKDCAAGAVLISAVLSAIIGIKIFTKSEYINAILNFFSEISNLVSLLIYVILSFIFVFLKNNKKD